VLETVSKTINILSRTYFRLKYPQIDCSLDRRGFAIAIASLFMTAAWCNTCRGNPGVIACHAIESLAKNGGTDDTIVVDRLLDKFRQARRSN
jgi:hypothetical protein